MTYAYVVELCRDFETGEVVTARGSLEAAIEHVRKHGRNYIGNKIQITRFDTETGDGEIVLEMEFQWRNDAPFWEETFRHATEEPTMTARDKIKQRIYPFVARTDGDGWAIHFPDLPGCQTYAESWDEVGPQARGIFEDWIDLLFDEGRPIPEPSQISDEDALPWPVELFTAESGSDGKH